MNGAVVFDIDRRGASGLVVDADGAGMCEDASSHFADLARTAFPQHAGAEARVVEGFDEGFDLAAVAQGIKNGAHEAEPVDALGSPVGADLSAGDAPDFFRVGLEEGAVKTIAKAVADPVLKGILGQEGLDPRLHIAGEHHEALEETKIANGVQDLERVLVKFISVKNAGQAGDLEHRLIHHVCPEALHILALREKPVATDVDAVVAPAVGA